MTLHVWSYAGLGGQVLRQTHQKTRISGLPTLKTWISP